MKGLASILNRQGEEQAGTSLGRCCGSRRWVEGMIQRRPFADDEAAFAAADEVWLSLDPTDWLEAFSHHSRIGDRQLESAGAGTEAWSRQEQAASSKAAAALLERLAAGNRVYEERFGHVFLIFATGKSAAGMLSALERRLLNKPEEELRLAAEEQRKITRLRLGKWAAESAREPDNHTLRRSS